MLAAYAVMLDTRTVNRRFFVVDFLLVDRTKVRTVIQLTYCLLLLTRMIFEFVGR